MSGNVFEWCSDFFNNTNIYHVLRGGSACRSSAYCESGANIRGGDMISDCGFRLLMEP